MGHDQLKKCSKYHLVSLLDEKQRSTFDIFLPFFIQVSLLTNSAFYTFLESLKASGFQQIFLFFLCVLVSCNFHFHRFPPGNAPNFHFHMFPPGNVPNFHFHRSPPGNAPNFPYSSTVQQDSTGGGSNHWLNVKTVKRYQAKASRIAFEEKDELSLIRICLTGTVPVDLFLFPQNMFDGDRLIQIYLTGTWSEYTGCFF